MILPLPSNTSGVGEPGSGLATGPALGAAYTLAAAPRPRLTLSQEKARDAILCSDRPEDYETVDCPCGIRGGDRLLSEVDRHGLPCRNVICLACGLIRLSPRWREARYERFYRFEYRSLYNPSLLSKTEYAREIAQNAVTSERGRWIEGAALRYRLPATPRLVELGAGAGWNLSRLPASWERVGYDVDDEYLEIGKGSFGVEMRKGLVEDSLPAVSRADIVLLSHVVEHFHDPERVLATLAGRLHPGALLLIEVPGLFRLHRTNLDVRSYLQNAHTFTYCARTLQDACRRAGLDVLEIDQSARAVCRPGSPGAQQAHAFRAGLAQRTIRYLRLCDSGYRQYAWLRRIPWMGRYAAALWKRTYFEVLGLAVSRELR
jgi:SAM-dependent methyltransferase